MQLHNDFGDMVSATFPYEMFLFFFCESSKILNEADSKLQSYSQIMLLLNVLLRVKKITL